MLINMTAIYKTYFKFSHTFIWAVSIFSSNFKAISIKIHNLCIIRKDWKLEKGKYYWATSKLQYHFAEFGCMNANGKEFCRLFGNIFFSRLLKLAYMSLHLMLHLPLLLLLLLLLLMPHRIGIWMSVLAMRHTYSALCLVAFVWRLFHFIYMCVWWMYANIELDELCKSRFTVCMCLLALNSFVVVVIVVELTIFLENSLEIFLSMAFSILFHHRWCISLCTIFALSPTLQFQAKAKLQNKRMVSISHRFVFPIVCAFFLSFSLSFSSLVVNRVFRTANVVSEISNKMLETLMHIFYRQCYLYIRANKNCKMLTYIANCWDFHIFFFACCAAV